MRHWIAQVVAAALTVAVLFPAGAGTQAFTVVDDPDFSRAVREVRREFLRIVNYDRVDVCVLTPDPSGGDQVWLRAEINGDRTTYPASCVKLAYLAAAMVWSRESGLPYDHLDEHLRPMIVESSNVATGHVVDALSGAPNYTDAAIGTEEYDRWVEARRYTERFLAERGLLGTQVVVHKTFPSNSGSSPTGAESLARETEGMNAMCPNLIAELMLEISHAAIEPEANDYMRELLRRDRWSGHSFFGDGLPPGTLLECKPGAAYDTWEDVARIVLPNGQEFIIAVFTDGRDGNSSLGTFASMLIDRMGWDDGSPARVRLEGPDVLAGRWSRGTMRLDRFSDTYWYHGGARIEGAAIWNLNVPETGFYEVTAWFPQWDGLATDAPYTVEHAGGVTEPIRVDQQAEGGQWVLLGEYFIEEGAGRVTLTNDVADPTQIVLADTVQATRFPPMSPEPGTDVVVDNDHVEPNYIEVGEWGLSPWLGHDGRTYSYGHTDTGATATYVAPLTEAGTYEISAHFRAGGNRATNSVYVVSTAHGDESVSIDQTGEDLVWRTLGQFEFEAGDATVVLDASVSTGGPVVISDALRLVKVE